MSTCFTARLYRDTCPTRGSDIYWSWSSRVYLCSSHWPLVRHRGERGARSERTPVHCWQNSDLAPGPLAGHVTPPAAVFSRFVLLILLWRSAAPLICPDNTRAALLTICRASALTACRARLAEWLSCLRPSGRQTLLKVPGSARKLRRPSTRVTVTAYRRINLGLCNAKSG